MIKRIVRYLAWITGIEKEIRDEKALDIAGQMKQHAWWWSCPGNEKVYNAFHLYADGLKGLKTNPSISLIRERVAKLGKTHLDGHDTQKLTKKEKP